MVEYIERNQEVYAMALVKNEIPILEYDTEKKAVIMPGHHPDNKFPERAAILFMESEVEDFAVKNKCEIVREMNSFTKTFPIYKIQHNHVDMIFMQMPCGRAEAVQIMERLIAEGVKK